MNDNISNEDEQLEKRLKKDRKIKGMVYVVALTAALAGLLFGLDIGVISGALPFIAKQFSAGTHTQEFIVSSILVGAVVGTLISGLISRMFGRKNALLVSAVVFALGSVLCAFSQKYPKLPVCLS